MPPAPRVKQKKRKVEDDEELKEEEGPTIIPKDQVKLTAKQLDEDMPRVLTATNPQAAQGLVAYSFAAREYRPVPATSDGDLVMHFKQISTTMHSLSEEATAQREYDAKFRKMVEDRRHERLLAAQQEGKELSVAELEEDDTQRNQFNFTGRAAQTYTHTTKTRVVSTQPPDSTNAQGFMSQWALHDAYVAEYERLLALMSQDKGAKKRGGGGEEEDKKGASVDPMHTPAMAARLAVMERLVNQVRAAPPPSPAPLPPSLHPLSPLLYPPPPTHPPASHRRTRRTRSTRTLGTGRTRATGLATRGPACRCGALRTCARGARWSPPWPGIAGLQTCSRWATARTTL